MDGPAETACALLEGEAPVTTNHLAENENLNSKIPPQALRSFREKRYERSTKKEAKQFHLKATAFSPKKYFAC